MKNTIKQTRDVRVKLDQDEINELIALTNERTNITTAMMKLRAALHAVNASFGKFDVGQRIRYVRAFEGTYDATIVNIGTKRIKVTDQRPTPSNVRLVPSSDYVYTDEVVAFLCDYNQTCPGHDSSSDRPCGYEP